MYTIRYGYSIGFIMVKKYNAYYTTISRHNTVTNKEKIHILPDLQIMHINTCTKLKDWPVHEDEQALQ